MALAVIPLFIRNCVVKAGKPLRDIKTGGEQKVSGCAAGCAGAILGAWLGAALAVGTIYICVVTVGGPLALLGFVQAFTILMGILGAIVGRNVGAAMARKPTAAASPLHPDLEQAARTHFHPSTPPPVATEDRIKQPDSPDTTEPAPRQPSS